VDAHDDKMAGIFVGERLEERVVDNAEDAVDAPMPRASAKMAMAGEAAIFQQPAKSKLKVAARVSRRFSHVLRGILP